MNDRTSAEHCYIGMTFLLYLFILLLSIIPRYSPNTPRDYLGTIWGLSRLFRDYPDLSYVFKVCSHVCMHFNLTCMILLLKLSDTTEAACPGRGGMTSWRWWWCPPWSGRGRGTTGRSWWWGSSSCTPSPGSLTAPSSAGRCPAKSASLSR